MLYSLSKHIAGFLLSQKCFEKSLLPVYIYGTELFLSSLLGVILVMTASVLTGNVLNGILFLLSFIFLRLFTGGLHCNSYFLCNTVMVLTFLSVITIKSLAELTGFSEAIYCLMMIFSLTVTVILAPVSNPNKEIPQKEKQKYRLISGVILLSHFILHMILNGYIGTGTVIVTDFFTGVFIIIGIIKNNTERRNHRETQKEHS